MSESLRDLLLKAGFKPAPQKPPKPGPPTPAGRKPASRKPQAQAHSEPDLAQAFALRAKVERAEREALEAQARAKAADRKERKRKVHERLAGAALNRQDADQPRNFEFAGKIRRVYVTPEQLRQLNAGELGVVMHGGRALVVTREVALDVQEIAAEVVALLVDPASAADDDGVPDDLIW